MKKRVLSLIMVLMLLFSIVPMNAFAATDITISTQPASITVDEGASAGFSIVAKKGTSTIHYLWFCVDAEGNCYMPEGSGDKNSLTISKVTREDDQTKVYCLVTSGNVVRTVVSNAIEKNPEDAKTVLDKAEGYSTSIAKLSTAAVLTVNKLGCEEHTVGKAATCTTKAVCDVCGLEFGEYDPANHSTDERTIELVEGSTTAYYECCADCGERVGDMKNCSHDQGVTEVEYLAATCTEDGHEAGYRCNVCGRVFSDAECTDMLTDGGVIKSEGHELHPGADILNMDYTALAEEFDLDDFLKKIEKMSAKDLIEFIGEAENYDYSSLKELKLEAIIDEIPYEKLDSCYDETYHWLGCQTCGKTLRELAADNEITGIDEAWLERSDKVEHTCTGDNLASCTHGNICDVCGNEYTEKDADNHGHLTQNISEDGKTYTITCDDCGAVVESGNVCKHTNLKHVAAVESGCTSKEGNIEYWYCSACKHYYADAECTELISKEDTVVEPGHDIHPDVEGMLTLDFSSITDFKKIIDTENLDAETIVDIYVEAKKELNERGIESIDDVSISDALSVIPYQYIDHCDGEQDGEEGHWLGCSKCGKSLYQLAQDDELELHIDAQLEQVSSFEAHSSSGDNRATSTTCPICDKCGCEYGTVCSHENVEKVTAREATCCQCGFTKACYYCPDCGSCFSNKRCTDEITDEVYVEKLDHTLCPNIESITSSVSVDDLKEILKVYSGWNGTDNFADYLYNNYPQLAAQYALIIYAGISTGVFESSIKELDAQQILEDLKMSDFGEGTYCKDNGDGTYTPVGELGNYCYDDDYHWMGCATCGQDFEQLIEGGEIEITFPSAEIEQLWLQVGAKSEHTPEVSVTAPDCDTPGYSRNACTECGHEFGSIFDITAATCHRSNAGASQLSANGYCPLCTQKVTITNFTDVKYSAKNAAWYYTYVQEIVANGYMSGYGDGKFGPNDSVTRAQMAQILYNMECKTLGYKPDVDISTNRFTDVTASAWYATAVAWASDNGIVNGYGNGKFGPEDKVTREQMVRMFYNYAKHAGYFTDYSVSISSFSDSARVDSWAAEPMAWAVGMAIVSGTDSNKIDPLGNATRAQIASIIYRFITAETYFTAHPELFED